MKAILVVISAFFSCLATASVFPTANGSFKGEGLANSNWMSEENTPYTSTIAVNDQTLTVTQTINGDTVKTTFTLTHTGEGFYKLDVKSVVTKNGPLEFTGSGMGNCHFDICHFNGKIDFKNDEVSGMHFSDVFYFGVANEITHLSAVDVHLVDDERIISYSFNESLTRVNEESAE